jgi:O-antigen/teichoic acid export membrane protein
VLLSFGAAGMVYGLSLATFCCIPVTWYYLCTKIAVPSIQTVRSLWEFARYIIVGRILGRTYSRIDTLFLSYFISQAAASYYEAAYRLTLPAMFLAVIAGSGVMAKIRNLESRGEYIDKEIINTVLFTSIHAMSLFFGSLVLSVLLSLQYTGRSTGRVPSS